MHSETLFSVASDVDIVGVRQKGRELAAQAGFSDGDQTVIAAAISEVARNIVNHATRGEIVLSGIHESSRLGIQVLARDEGPGIADIEQAMQYGYSSGKGMGVGLPGAKWLMDEFDIKSQVGKGTRVTMRKWVR